MSRNCRRSHIHNLYLAAVTYTINSCLRHVKLELMVLGSFFLIFKQCFDSGCNYIQTNNILLRLKRKLYTARYYLFHLHFKDVIVAFHVFFRNSRATTLPHLLFTTNTFPYFAVMLSCIFVNRFATQEYWQCFIILCKVFILYFNIQLKYWKITSVRYCSNVFVGWFI